MLHVTGAECWGSGEAAQWGYWGHQVRVWGADWPLQPGAGAGQWSPGHHQNTAGTTATSAKVRRNQSVD